jgi:hypothetical protein
MYGRISSTAVNGTGEGECLAMVFAGARDGDDSRHRTRKPHARHHPHVMAERKVVLIEAY